jgi:hypothetical protein
MNTLLALISAARFMRSDKLSLDALGLYCSARLVLTPGSGPSGLTSAPQLRHPDFWHEFKPPSQSCCYGNTPPSDPSFAALFPARRLRTLPKG